MATLGRVVVGVGGSEPIRHFIIKLALQRCMLGGLCLRGASLGRGGCMRHQADYDGHGFSLHRTNTRTIARNVRWPC